MAQKLQKHRDSPAHGGSLISEETKAASATEGLNIEGQEIIDDASETPVKDPTDQLESLEKKDDEESTERSAKSCETGLKVVNKEDGAEGSTKSLKFTTSVPMSTMVPHVQPFLEGILYLGRRYEGFQKLLLYPSMIILKQ